MKNISYTNKQMEAANLLRSVSDGKGVPSEVMDEILNMLGDAEQMSINAPSLKEETELTLKMKLMGETDWRKRASLSAMIISKSLE